MSENTSVGSLSESGVLITDELYQRPCRPLNLEAEVQILRALAQQLTRPPQAILKYLVSAAVDLCQAGTAGVSLIEILPNGEEVLRWVALAGVYEPYEGGITDREYSPCGVCLSRGCPQLYHHPERYFPSLQQADPAIVEELVVPLLLEGQALGTIWIASHSRERQFDSEDMRMMTSLADFTAAAIHSSRLRQAGVEVQQALRQSQAQVQTLVTNMPGMVYRYSPCADGVSRFIFVNSGCLELFEVEPKEAVQDIDSIWSLIHPDDRFSFQASVTAASENFLPWDWQGRIITPSGQLKWIQGKSSAVQTADGAVWDGLIIDITQRKQAELLLVEQKKLLELAASGHPLDECLSSLCASMCKLNPRVRACILLPNAQRSAFESFITPNFELSFGQGLKGAPINELAISTCGTAVYCGQPVTCSDIAKDERWSQGWRDLCVAHGILACHSAPVLGLDGQSIGSLMLCFDEARMPTDWEYQLAEFGTHIASIVFERDRSNLALRESEELKQRILESSNDCIKVLTLNGEVQYISEGGRCLLEIDDPTSFLNMNWVSFWQGEDYENALAALAAAKAGSMGEFQGYLPTMKGLPKWWDSIISPIRDESGKVVQLVAISRDITKQKLAEAERERLLQREQTAREEAESANRIKDEFLAVLSHELRSPLNPILGWTSLLRNGRLDAAKTAYALETIERNAKLQVQLIEDLLDISRILSGKLSLNVMPVDLSVVIKAALETVRLAAEVKLLQIQTKFSPQVVTINADAGRLQQVLWNLLSNAVKFTPDGGEITVALTIAENYAQIQVSDIGIGINPDFLPYIFEHFRQEDGATTRKFGGLGLGLAIARQIVELHGGTIQVESSGEGQGATFIVKLPLPRNKNYGTTDEQIAVLPRLRDLPLSNVQVLVVDDDTDTREFILFVLELAGAIVTSVPSAIAALEVLAQSKFDVLVSDIGMPEMDGYMLMRQIREMEQGKPISAVALTAYAGETDQAQALLAGFQKHVSKPIEPEMLVQTIISLIACG
ncbi:ATP-binding protein [Nostoc sp. DedQUE09]|uniref:hybrid sensor histidine kinase/response regulator n=1 Tax=Nostoc sp. DedQUE09 TaxID=3075394 RepID=UPI002AD567C6|nr:ATP-binding protein [Nostoc sp. DedQUE09]MDZ7950720.1 ATP-binding protein [Nostoc sp. DedQUE09]